MKKLIYFCAPSDVGDSDNQNVNLYLYRQERTCSDDQIDRELEIAKMDSYNGEVTVEDIPDEPQEPTTEQRVSELEEQIIQADETAIALYEAQEEQEAINAQQDEALMEIYEMIG